MELDPLSFFCNTYIQNKIMIEKNKRQSRIFISETNRSSQLVDDEIDPDNPENNFDKIMNVPSETPAKQFRNIIQLMSEQCTFQKNIIKKTSGIKIPDHTINQIRKRQVFQDYEALRKYTVFSKKQQHFLKRKFASRASNKDLDAAQSSGRSKSISSGQGKRVKTQVSYSNSSSQKQGNKPLSLLKFVQGKKNKMLLQDNILKFEQNHVAMILNSDKKREKIFEQALFLERMFDIEIEKLKGVGVKGQVQVPQKFKGVEPKHIRIGSHSYATEQQYERKKYVWKKRKLQFYDHAQKIEKLSLASKKKQNLEVISTLMKFNESIYNKQPSKTYFGQSIALKDLNINQRNLKIKRLFLKYSTCQIEKPEEMYQYMGQQQIKQFLTDFQLDRFSSTIKQFTEFIQKKRDQINKKKGIPGAGKYSIFDFLQMLYILAAAKCGQENNVVKFDQFADLYIISKQQKCLPTSWVKLKKIKRSQKMVKTLKVSNFEERAKQLFESKSTNSENQFSIALIGFNQLLDLCWELKLFPIRVPKKSLRFIYLFCKSAENGLSLFQFFDTLLIIAIQYGPEGENQLKLRWMAKILKSQC